MIRSVRISGDQPIYLGGGNVSGKSPDAVKIPQKTNNISFVYSGLSYIMPDYNEFSIIPDGYDRNWSGWMKDTRYNYTNLPPGHYVFRTKCRNIIGQEGSEATFAFTILTPWYLTLWAFLGYIILAAAGIYSLVLFCTRKLRQRSRELEKIVEARTAQIQEQKNNVEQLSKIGRDITSSLSIENADAYRRLAVLLDELKATQENLVSQSKLAALGALTAGIAHEIKNPLNFVNNFASLNTELLEELQTTVAGEKENLTPGALEEIEEIIGNLKENAGKIQEHGKRADSIVRSMLQHSRGGSGELLPTNINATLEEAINLTYHGMRAQDAGFNIKIEKSLDESIGKMDVITQELSRAFLNIINNGCYEAHRKKLTAGSGFSPVISVKTQKKGNMVKISKRDNGNGIPVSVRTKLFTPFFPTKPAGKGTGLGLGYASFIQRLATTGNRLCTPGYLNIK